MTWKLSYAAIVPLSLKPQQAEATPAPKPEPSDFQVGNTVAFTDKHLRERVGKITRINSKTCSVDCEDSSQWRVSPQMLRKIIDL